MNKKIFSLTVALTLFILSNVSAAPYIIDKPILWTAKREYLALQYAKTHYGLNTTTIVPKAVVVHWTAGSTFSSAYNHFYHEQFHDGTLNVSSQFIVDRDGAIYRLTPETSMNRHVIGYNHCAIGIENVGGVGGREDLTGAQLQANVALIRYLHEKYPTIKYVFGHYQQVAARISGLYVENVKGYASQKIDPGRTFMAGLRQNLAGDGLLFFDD